MNAAGEDVCRSGIAGRHAADKTWPRTMLGLVLAAALALPAGIALAQDGGGGGNPIMPKFSIGDREKRLTPEERERQKQIDADYKAATSKIPAQKASDPWADMRQAPSASAAKKKQQQ